MARRARVVVPGVPHHIVQRGNRNQTVFFSGSDRNHYLAILSDVADESGVEFLAWCLMNNHIHLVAVPKEEVSFSKCFRKAHSLYAYHVNAGHGWRGHLWQYRYHSSTLDPHYLYNAVRYTEQNPVRAGITDNAWSFEWSSAKFHTGIKETDPLINADVSEMMGIDDWMDYLSIEPDTVDLLKLRESVKRNMPAARQWFLSRLHSNKGINFPSDRKQVKRFGF